MTYDEFKTHLIGYLWKVGDAQLIADLDNLIKMGESLLNTDLEVETRYKSVSLLAITSTLGLPDDYHSMRGVTDKSGKLGTLLYVDPMRLEEERASTGNRWLPYYSLRGKSLLLSGPLDDRMLYMSPTPPASPEHGDLWSRTVPPFGIYTWYIDPTSSQWVQVTEDLAVTPEGFYSLLVTYKAKVPDFKGTGASWVVDDHLALYTYATLVATAPYLREDERLPQWQQLYDKALADIEEDSLFNKQRGVAAAPKMAHSITGKTTRRRSR